MSKYERDNQIVTGILNSDVISTEDKRILLSILPVSYHDSGKIEGICSIDSSASACAFCDCMRKAAEKNPSIICGLCYDHAQEQYRTNVKNRHGLNARILSAVEYPRELLAEIRIPADICRFNSSGDLVNKTHLINLVNIAAVHPDVKFTLWTKRAELLRDVFPAMEKPANLTIILSSILINRPAVNVPDCIDAVFTVYTPARIAAAIASGERACNGKKCIDCNYSCYLNTARGNSGPVYIAEKLRGASAKTLQLIDSIT